MLLLACDTRPVKPGHHESISAILDEKVSSLAGADEDIVVSSQREQSLLKCTLVDVDVTRGTNLVPWSSVLMTAAVLIEIGNYRALPGTWRECCQ
jgi:hypothetical protein